MKQKRISVLGNIGCGKTTVLEGLDVPVALEPVQEWKEWLALFYQDMQRWGLTFNAHILNTYADLVARNNHHPLVVYERSPMCCRYVFTELQYQCGLMNRMEMEVFHQLYKKIGWEPDVAIYIRSDPEICMQRMQQRNRSCESSVTQEYLQSVHNQHETMIQSLTIPVHIVDGNMSSSEVLEKVQKIVATIGQQGP